MKPLDEQINPKFVQHAKKLSKITQFLNKFLPVECRGHVQVGNIQHKTLNLITDSPVWTTRVRQLSPQLIQYINDNSRAFTTCLKGSASQTAQTSTADNDNSVLIHHVRVSTRYSSANDSARKGSVKKQSQPLKLSRNSARLLSQSADSIQHEELRSSLRKLARHAAEEPE